MMKYKLHDILTDRYYPSSNEVYYGNLDIIFMDIFNNSLLKEALEVLVYEDSAFFEHPKEISLLSDFTIRL